MAARSGSGHDGYGPSGRSAWLDVDWREHLRSVEIGGRRANVVDVGSGPPLLFVHGLSGCWQNWLENIPHFARTHRVIAPDLPGFGESEMPARDISMPGYASFLDALCDELGVEGPLPVVGNSMGGLIAAELALVAPSRVERLALVSPAGVTTESVRREPILAVTQMIAWLNALGGSRREALAARPGARRLVLGLVCHRADLLPAETVYQLTLGGGKPGFLPAQRAILGHPLCERLHQIACPTLIVWGRNDRIIPVRDAERLKGYIPHARKVVWPHTGHVAMLERPDRFNALLEEFLAEPAPAAAAAAPAAGAAEAAPDADAAPPVSA
jgi:pimeloyl-ACP methyl ester carboxylesterase